MPQRPHVIAVVLAGGEGRRLHPLTRERAKPAVPFGGHYRLIDFVLSNLANAGFLRIFVLTQYKNHSLDRHLAQTWRLSALLGNYVAALPAQQRRGPTWYLGSADAVWQNLDVLEDEDPDHVIVFGADHIYRMDPRQMLDQHIATGAGVTVAAIPVPQDQASEFGVIDASAEGRIRTFLEKPAQPPAMPDRPGWSYASMGNYIFSMQALREAVSRDAASDTSRHDMGGNIIPALVGENRAWVYDFAKNQVPGQVKRERGYWRDVGSVDAYHEASMDLVEPDPVFDLYNREWPIYTWREPLPPAKFVHESGERVGRALDSLVADGCIVSGGSVRKSILFPRVRVNSFADVSRSILFEGVEVGRGAVVKNAIIDKGVRIPPGFEVGVDHDADRARGITVSAGGIAVVGKGDVLE